MIQPIKKDRSFSDNQQLENYLNKFFIIGKIETKYELIMISQIVNKFVIKENKEEVV